MTENKYLRFALRLGSILLAAAAAYLALRFALPWLLPFVLALITARLVEPLVLLLKRKLGFRRGFSAAVCTLVIVGGTITLLVFATIRAVGGLANLAMSLPTYLSGLPAAMESIEARLRDVVASSSPQLQSIMDSAIAGISKQLSELPMLLSSKLLSLLSSCAACLPDVMLFSVTYAIGTFFISASYPSVIRFLVRQFPEKWQNRVRTIRSDLFGVLGKWARAQIILMGVTFAELFMAFMLFKIRPALTLAIVIAVIDMLPVLGTGTVLIPWAVLMLLAGRFGLATQLAITYGVVSIVRSCLEPKIIGSGMGLHPAATLLAMYMGYCLMGVAGIILFPFLLLFLKQLNDSEYIRLWK